MARLMDTSVRHFRFTFTDGETMDVWTGGDGQHVASLDRFASTGMYGAYLGLDNVGQPVLINLDNVQSVRVIAFPSTPGSVIPPAEIAMATPGSAIPPAERAMAAQKLLERFPVPTTARRIRDEPQA